MKLPEYLWRHLIIKQATPSMDGVICSIRVGQYQASKNLGMVEPGPKELTAAYKACFQYLIDKYSWETIIMGIFEAQENYIKLRVE